GTNAGGQHVVVAQPAAVSPPAPGAQAAVAPPGVPAKSQLVEIKSPMVGTFYAAPEPGAAPYVKAGSRVATGQVVCIIEAMKIMTPRQVKEFAEHKEADFAIGVPGVGRFRTNVYQQRGTVAFAFRSIPYEVKTIHELNLPPVLEEIAIKPRGLVLVTGVTGSG